MPRGINNKKLSDDDIQAIIEAYTTPLPDGTWVGVPTIARRFGVANSCIQYHLKRNGVTFRNSKEALAGKQTKPITSAPPEGEPPPLCKCGCEQPVAWNRRKAQWYVYVRGHYRRHKRYHDASWLRQQYLREQKTVNEIAEESGATKTTILRHLRRLNIPIRTQAETLRINGSMAGKNNPAWKGGVTPERQALYKTRQWSTLVKSVLARDNYRCQRCQRTKGDDGVILHVHHIYPWASFPNLRFNLNNLVTLCSLCHTWVHSTENKKHEFLAGG